MPVSVVHELFKFFFTINAYPILPFIVLKNYLVNSRDYSNQFRVLYVWRLWIRVLGANLNSSLYGNTPKRTYNNTAYREYMIM